MRKRLDNHGLVSLTTKDEWCLAEVDALRAQLEAAREAVANLREREHSPGCAYWPDDICRCSAAKHNESLDAARLALGLEDK